MHYLHYLQHQKAYLEYELNFVSMEMAVHQMLVKTLEMAIRAPDRTLRSIVFEKWSEYRCQYSYNDLRRTFGNGMNELHNQTILSREEKIKREIENCDESDWYKIEKSKIIEERYAIAICIIPYPENLMVFYNFYDVCYDINNNEGPLLYDVITEIQ